MKRRILAILLAVIMLLPQLTAPAAAADGSCYDDTPQMVRDTLQYLDEIYRDAYPEMALQLSYGTDEDKQVLKTMADIITADCGTLREKADAVCEWILKNMKYSLSESAYSIDAFYSRVGNCMSYAQLMQDFLRLEGVPAVMAEGWRGEMKRLTAYELFQEAGHAWCWVYLDGMWVLYDPLFSMKGITDREYMAEWYYMSTVEAVSPVYDSTRIPPAPSGVHAYYIDGRFMAYNGTDPEVRTGNILLNINNLKYASTVNNPNDGWKYLDDANDKSQMIPGELYRGGWIAYGFFGGGASLKYAYPNGIQASATVVTRDGVDYFADGGTCYRIAAEKGAYSIRAGMFTLPVGYTGKTILPNELVDVSGGRTVTWSSSSSCVRITEDGVVTSLSAGIAHLDYRLRNSSGAELSSGYVKVVFTDETRVPHYTHDTTEVLNALQATCTTAGYSGDVVCTVCGKVISEGGPVAALGHQWDGGVVTTPPAEGSDGVMTYTCTVCGETKTESIPALGHTHAYAEETIAPTCTEQGYTMHSCACGACYQDHYTPALGHSWDSGVVTKEPTETEKGIKTYTCIRCAATRTETIPELAHTHAYTDAVTEPSCTERGYITHTCVCGDSYVDSYVPALGHVTEVKNAKAPACTAAGYTGDEICSACGVTVRQGADIAALGHDYHDGVCTRCGAEDPDYKPVYENPFTDLKQSEYYYDPVLWAVHHNPQITNGMSTGKFAPSASCTRAQVVTFLWRAMGCPEPEASACPFADVASSQYYYKAVLWAAENGITTGATATTFAPNMTVTRAQFVTFLWRAVGKPAANGANPFKDVSSSQYYYDAVLWAVQNGITTGVTATTFVPNSPCTRGQVVTFLYRQLA